jgi:hypothetical protein
MIRDLVITHKSFGQVDVGQNSVKRPQNRRFCLAFSRRDSPSLEIWVITKLHALDRTTKNTDNTNDLLAYRRLPRHEQGSDPTLRR